MSNTIKVFVVGYGSGYASWIQDKILVEDIEEADVIVFTGGQDINPKIYGCQQHETTYFSQSRDDFELSMYHQVRPDQICYGACRGAQLGAALNGAILVQDVENHWCSGTHYITVFNDNSTMEYFDEIGIKAEDYLQVPSLHHQMIYPYDLSEKDCTLMYVSKTNRSSYYHGDKIDKRKINILRELGEPEVMIFHKENEPVFFGVQGHPEMLRSDHPTNIEFNKILRALIKLKKND